MRQVLQVVRHPSWLRVLTSSGQVLGYMPYPVTNSEQCPDLSVGVDTEGSNSQLLERQRERKVTSLLFPEYGTSDTISW